MPANTQNSQGNAEPPEEDTFKILVASDIHLGYAEKNLLRGQDSFNAFEEVLQIAEANEVDFILLGGDLFDSAKPSTYCMLKCTELLKRYCLGSKPINMEYLSDPSLNFRNLTNPVVNYDDPNLNVSIPVFSIHGNHDDPSGPSQVSSLDILASAGLVNYFGKWHDLTEVVVSPILLKKGRTNLALYGLSHIRDERLGRLFRDKKVIFEQVEQGAIDSEDEDWYSILVLHQNRACNRGAKNYIPEDIIPEFFDLVVWGHEHDCRIEPEEMVNGVFISQPGSTVATSLAIGESGSKYVGLLTVYKNKSSMKPIRLKTVRPFVYDEMVLGKEDKVLAAKEVEERVAEKVEEILRGIKTNPELMDSKLLPLVRLTVFYHEEQCLVNSVKFGQRYLNIVANYDSLLVMKSATKKERRLKNDNDHTFAQNANIAARTVEDLVKVHFETDLGENGLKLMSLKALTDAVSRFISADDQEAVEDVVTYQKDKTCAKLKELNTNEEDIEGIFAQLRNQSEDGIDDVVQNVFNNPGRKVQRRVVADDDVDSEEADVIDDEDASPSKMKPTRGRGRGSRGGRGARGKKDDSSVGVSSAGSSSSDGKTAGRAKRGRYAALK